MDYTLTYSDKKIEMSVKRHPIFGFAIGRNKEFKVANWVFIIPFLIIEIIYKVPQKGEL